MKRLVILLCLAWPNQACAQLTDAEKKATLSFVRSLYDPSSGAFRVDSQSKPSLRATSGAVRVHHYLNAEKLGIKLPDPSQTRSFVASCYDAASGGFREPDARPDPTITSIALLACGDLGITEQSYPRVLEFLKANARTFEEVRIGAAAIEAIRKKPDWLNDWIRIADAQLNNDGTAGQGDEVARMTASVTAMKLRLGYPVANKTKVTEALLKGQRSDGGWGARKSVSDLETTYRVMRALHLLKEKPKDTAKLRAFLASCRNSDGGYSTESGNPSTMSGTYYAAAVGRWME